MEFNFSISRIVLLGALIVIFYFLGGFTPPSLDADSILSPRRVSKAWMYCVVLYLAGAVCVSIIDHFVGTIERSNLRPIYIVLGIVLMAGSSIYIRGLDDVTYDTDR